MFAVSNNAALTALSVPVLMSIGTALDVHNQRSELATFAAPVFVQASKEPLVFNRRRQPRASALPGEKIEAQLPASTTMFNDIGNSNLSN